VPQTFTSLSQAAKKINTSVKSGSRKALNDAVRATNKEVLDELKAETKLPQSFIKQRIWMYTATVKIPVASIKIAVQRAIHIADPVFKPKEKKVVSKVSSFSRKTKHGEVSVKGHRRTFFGVTAVIGNAGRQLIDNGFLRILSVGKANRKLKEIVLARKGASAYPTTALKTDIFQVAARKVREPAINMLVRLFNANMSARVDDAMSKSFDTKDD
jgi:hypothetical protein